MLNQQNELKNNQFWTQECKNYGQDTDCIIKFHTSTKIQDEISIRKEKFCNNDRHFIHNVLCIYNTEMAIRICKICRRDWFSLRGFLKILDADVHSEVRT